MATEILLVSVWNRERIKVARWILREVSLSWHSWIERLYWKPFAEDDGLIHSKPVRDFVSIALENNFSVSSIICNDLLTQPTAVRICKEQGQIPMEQSDDWFDAVLQTCVDQVVIVLEGKLVHWTFTKWEDSGP